MDYDFPRDHASFSFGGEKNMGVNFCSMHTLWPFVLFCCFRPPSPLLARNRRDPVVFRMPPYVVDMIWFSDGEASSIVAFAKRLFVKVCCVCVEDIAWESPSIRV